MFVNILRHLFTYKRLKLGFFAPRDREAIDPSAIFVAILRDLFTYQRLELDLFTCDVMRSLTPPPCLLTFYVICLHIKS